ncbi:MAG: extracellular solute-binding protein, partial [Nocardioidaceae bacterium]
DQSRAVEGGLAADYVNFSAEPDMARLVDDGIVSANWDKGPTHGMVTNSVVVFVVRKGNPKHIHTWADLVKPGVKIVTPDPASSGSAKWNILAAYGQVLARGGSAADAKAYLTKFFEHTVALPSSGRDATTAFESGNGDVLISYENEAILARAEGADFDYLVPDQTILIQNPAAVTKTANPLTKKWLAYVLSKPAQTTFYHYGFRPVLPGIHTSVPGANDPNNPFPTPKVLLTIKNFRGWTAADAKFFDNSTSIVPTIQTETGKQ